MAEGTLEWLSDEALEDIRSLTGAALVVFTAQWCAPCQELIARLERLSSRYASRVHCYLVDVDRHPESARKYGVRGTPTLMLFMEGDLEATRVGALDEKQLDSFLGVAL